MSGILKLLFFRRKDDFTTKVLERYSSGKTVSPFARSLFSSESADSINDRFAKARRKVTR